jgi:signal transduction histidine kinase
MRSVETSSRMDWLAISLRWMTLIGLCISLSARGGSSPVLSIVLVSAALWNILLSFLIFFDRKLGLLRPLSVVFDIAFANLFFFLSGALVGSLGWAGLLPTLSAAFYLNIWVAIGAVSATVISMGAQVFILSTASSAILYMGTSGVVYLLLTVLINGVGFRLTEGLYRARRERNKGRQTAMQRERDRRHNIFNLLSMLSATLNYERVLDTALDLSASALGASDPLVERLVSAVLLFNQDRSKNTHLAVASSRRFTSADLRTELPGTAGILERVIDGAEPVLASGLSSDPELGRIIALRTCKAAYCIPLRSGLEAYGVLLFAHPEGDYFTPERRELLDIIGHQAMIAIQNARLYRDLELEKERMMEIQEEARKKLARDLHDGPTQSVAALAMRVNFARRLMERDNKAASEELYKVEELARRTTKEIRHMLFTLRPLVLESQGLIAALESMAEKMRETFSQNVIIEADQNIVHQIEMSKQVVVFYIAEEAVNNARKHAQADHIWVRLRPAEDDLAILEIEDDGSGFDIGGVDSTYENRGSLGMVNMRERAELINGILRIESASEKGTIISLLIPITDEAAEYLHRGL